MRLIVSAMKNEGPFILEWVAHHLATGFDQFLIYTNDCDDGTDAIWARLAELGYGAHVDNDDIRPRGVQKSALMRADKHPLAAASEWISCIDVDEFINIKAGAGTLDDLFDALPPADMIALCWRRYGSSNVMHFVDAPVTEQFIHAAPVICPYPFHNYGFKSLWRRNAGWKRIGVHRPLDPDPDRLNGLRVVNGAGQSLPLYREKGLWLQPQTAGYEHVQLNHYALRSAESFLIKRDRGLPNSKFTHLDLGYWAERNFNQVVDRSVLERNDEMRSILERLKADETLMRLHETAVELHQEKIKKLLRDQEALKLFLRVIVTQTAVLPRMIAAQLNPLIAFSWDMERKAKNGQAE